MRDGRAGRAEVALSSVLHDPEGRLLPWAERHAAGLGAYAAAAVAATPQTDRRVLAVLRQAGAVLLPGGPEVGTARRRALAAAAAARPGLPVLTIDFDRWLYWREHAPEELAAVAAFGPGACYVCLGRTAAAFASHPRVQRVCEGATNRALSLAAGRPMDATAGAALLRPAAICLVLAGSREPTNATDLEWPALVLRGAPDRRQVACRRCRGLAFETAALHAAEVAAAGGLEAWVAATYERPEVWAARLRLAADSAAALERVVAGG